MKRLIVVLYLLVVIYTCLTASNRMFPAPFDFTSEIKPIKESYKQGDIIEIELKITPNERFISNRYKDKKYFLYNRYTSGKLMTIPIMLSEDIDLAEVINNSINDSIIFFDNNTEPITINITAELIINTDKIIIPFLFYEVRDPDKSKTKTFDVKGSEIHGFHIQTLYASSTVKKSTYKEQGWLNPNIPDCNRKDPYYGLAYYNPFFPDPIQTKFLVNKSYTFNFESEFIEAGKS